MALFSNTTSLSENRLRVFQHLRNDFCFYAPRALKIKDKAGVVVPFQFNAAQTYIHKRLEEQKKLKGMVRAVIVKGRQQGCSTYIEGRFFHRATLVPGTGVFILAHEVDATLNLFRMVGRYYDNTPPPIRPDVKVSNKRCLEFAGVGSSYSVGTAGTGAGGRSSTIQCFHGSEVAYWPNTDEIVTGVLQAVPGIAGTEIIFESTANGMGNFFHSKALNGTEPDSDYITIFIPWFWQTEYTREDVPKDFFLTPEECELVALHSLTNGQIYWRRRKIKDEFDGKTWKFQREYPNTLEEAFVSSGIRLLNAAAVQAARHRRVDGHGPLILGVDPAREGDKTVLCLRRGRKILWWKKFEKMDEVRLAGIIADLLDSTEIDKVFIDVAHGYGTIDILRNNGYTSFVTGVQSSSSAIRDDVYSNIRAEMADSFKKWFEEGPVEIPDDDEAVLQLLSIGPLDEQTGSGKLLLESKKDIKKRLGRSPDCYDAAALTFAYPVSEAGRHRVTRVAPQAVRKTSPLATIRRFAKSQEQTVFTERVSFN